MNNITYYILSLLAVLIILTVHEYSHGYAAYKLGDNTAKNLGRLSLNPIKHLDPMGAICMVFFHFGWAKPVPINARNFKKPKRDIALVALAGPLSNLVMAFIFCAAYLWLNVIYVKAQLPSGFLRMVFYNSVLFVYIFHLINIGLGIFNLIPVPPLDGSRILCALLPTKIYFGIMKYERHIYLGLIAWLFLGTYVSQGLLSIPFISTNPILSFIAELFSLSGMLGKLIAFISRQMMNFWQLFPIFNL